MPTFLDAVATAVLTYATHSAVACAVALLAARMIRRPQDRDIVWKTALVAPLFTAATAMLASAAGRANAFVDLAFVARQALRGLLPGRRVIVRVLETSAGRDVFRQLNDPVARTLSSIAILLALLCMTLAIVRLARRRRALALALSPRRIVETCATMSNGRAVELSITDDLQSPVAFGGARICIPSSVMSDFAPEQRRALIAHELAHLERRDPAWLFATEIIVALSAFQPLVFFVARAFRRDVELICDEAALRGPSDRRALIGALALLAAPFDSRSPLAGSATAYDGSPLVARAKRIAHVELDGQQRTYLVAAAVGSALVALLFASPVVSSSPRMSDFPADPSVAARALRDGGRMVVLDSTVRIDSTFTVRRKRAVLVVK